jgi:FkbM family methyltransferase
MEKRNSKFNPITKIKRVFKNPWVEIYNLKKNLFFNLFYGGKKDYVMNYKNIQTKFLTNDEYSKHWFFPHCDKGKMHEPIITKMIIDSLKEEDVFVDVGAHLGYYTCIAGKICDKVFGFEVDKHAFELLVKNIKYNNLSNVEMFNYAVTNKNCLVKIPKSSCPNRFISIINDDNPSNYCSVKAVSLDEFLKKKDIKPSIVKIDVEGAELLVLEGMQSLLKNENITLFLEVHGKRLCEFNTNSEEIISFLNNCGYKVYEILNHRSIDLQLEKRMVELYTHKSIDYNTMLYVTKTK